MFSLFYVVYCDVCMQMFDNCMAVCESVMINGIVVFTLTGSKSLHA